MADETRSERFDRLVEALLAGRRPDAPTEGELEALVEIAARVRLLPRTAFRERLGAELARRARIMRSEETNPTPVREGFSTVTPYLVTADPAGLVLFVTRAFGGAKTLESTGSAGGTHAEVRIAGSMLMIGGGAGFGARPAELHLYVEDVDEAYRRALTAGASSLYEPMDQPYGDREAGVKDFSGNHWYLATHAGTGGAPEGMRAVTPVLHSSDVNRQIEFLTAALGASDIVRDTSPDGTLVHATARVGDSVVEMGPAQGRWRTMPAMLYLYVADVDAWYRRAIEAGAASVQAPKDEPYGDRVAAFRDEDGNLWYLGTPLRGRSGPEV